MVVVNHLWKILWRFVLPLTLLYLGRSDTGVLQLQESGILGENINADFVKNCLFGLGVFLGFIAVPFSLYRAEYRNKQLVVALSGFLRFNKVAFVDLLRKELNCPGANFNVRIFIKSEKIIDRVKIFFEEDFGNEVEKLRIHNLNGLAHPDGTEGLTFRVKSKYGVEGLVGMTYSKKKIFYDCNVANHKDNPYNLTVFQKSKTSRVKFVLTAPIFDNKNCVIAVIAIDSENRIKEPKNLPALENCMINYCQKLHEHMPVILNEFQ